MTMPGGYALPNSSRQPIPSPYAFNPRSAPRMIASVEPVGENDVEPMSSFATASFSAAPAAQVPVLRYCGAALGAVRRPVTIPRISAPEEGILQWFRGHVTCSLAGCYDQHPYPLREWPENWLKACRQLWPIFFTKKASRSEL